MNSLHMPINTFQVNKFSFLVGNILFSNAYVYLKIGVVCLKMGDVHYLERGVARWITFEERAMVLNIAGRVLH
jgi:hypothetical protein